MKKLLSIILAFIFPFCYMFGETKKATDSLLSLGHEYYSKERYMDALDVLSKAIKAADKTHDDYAYIQAYVSIGNIYTIFDDYEQALHYYKKSLEKAYELKNKESITTAKCNMLLCYANLGMAREAQICYESIGTISMDSKDKSRFYTYLNQALLAKAKKNYKAAIFFHSQAMEYAKSHDMEDIFVAAEMGQLGVMHEEIKDNKKAEEWFLKCVDVAKKGNCIGPLTSAYEHLANVYGKEGNDSLSLHYQKLFTAMRDSFFLQKEFNSKRSQIANYESQRSDMLISSLSNRNTFLIWVIVIFVALLATLIVLTYYIYRKNRQLVITQRLLIQKHKEYDQQLAIQNEIFVNNQNQSENESVNEAVQETDDPDLLNKQQTERLLQQVAHVMEDSSCICDPSFSLQMLAQKVESNTKYVSWAINKTYNKNFKTYLNEYRIRKAAKMLTDKNHYGNLTIAAIAEKVGYKSPTSFHQAFKKVYGMTPMEYQKLDKITTNDSEI